MVKNDVEVEIKFPVNKKIFDNVKKNLKTNSKFINSSEEIDRYYNSPHRNFLAKVHPSEYLRVRTKDGGGSFTYKNVYFNKKGERTHSDKYESKVANSKQVEKILAVLNFDNFITIRKKRETLNLKTNLILHSIRLEIWVIL